MSDMGCYTSANLYSQYVLEQGFGSLASEQDDSGKRSNSSPINKLDNEWLGGNVRFEWDADDFQLTSITAVLSYNFGQVYDFDASPLSLFTETSQTKMDAWSQEFRFQGELGDSTYWLAGLSYADETIDALRNSDLSQYQDFPSIGHRAFEQVTQSWAAYAQVEYQLSDHWRFNSSIRFTDEDKSLNNYRFFESEGAGIDFNESGDIAPFYWLSGVNKNYELGSQWSGHIGIDWTPTEDILVYGKVTRGFKSGGFFGGFAFAEDELTPYEEELVTSYEIGLKSELFDNSLRFNAAAFYYNYEDVQGFTQVFNSSTNSILTKLGNLGDAEHQGIELEMVWLPESLPGLQLSAQYAYLDAEISDSDTIALDPAGIPGPLEGTRRSSAPKNSAGLQLSYQLDLSDSVILDVAAYYSWRSDVNPRSVYNTDLDYSLFGIESYQVMGLRLGLALEDHWQLALLGDNLSNETYVVSTSSDDLGSYNKIPGRPRSWTLEVSYNW